MRKQFDRAAAEAFADVTTFESACYHYLVSNFDTQYKAHVRQHFISALTNRNIKAKHIDTVVDTALGELTYPMPTNGDKYLWSCRDRAAFCGMAKSTWYDNNLCEHTNFIIDTVRLNAHRVSIAIYIQLGIHSINN